MYRSVGCPPAIASDGCCNRDRSPDFDLSVKQAGSNAELLVSVVYRRIWLHLQDTHGMPQHLPATALLDIHNCPAFYSTPHHIPSTNRDARLENIAKDDMTAHELSYEAVEIILLPSTKPQLTAGLPRPLLGTEI